MNFIFLINKDPRIGLIGHRFNDFACDRCLIDVDPMFFRSDIILLSHGLFPMHCYMHALKIPEFLNKQNHIQIRVLLTCMSFPCTELAVSSFSASMPVSDQLSWSRTDVTPPRGTNTHQHRCQGSLTWAKNQLGSNPGSCAAIRRSYKSNDKAFIKKRLWLLSIRCPLLPGQLIGSCQWRLASPSFCQCEVRKLLSVPTNQWFEGYFYFKTLPIRFVIQVCKLW